MAMNLIVLVYVVILALSSPCFGTEGRCTDAFAQTGEQEASKSEVRVIDSVPRLFINGKELSTGSVNVYYLPDMGIETKNKNEVPLYGDPQWLLNTKALIDQAVNNGARLVLLNVWWKDLDKSKSRPKNIADNLDFGQLDAIFDYTREKNAYIIPVFVFFPFAPDWWLKENNFPPYHKDKVCSHCETDSYGNVYNNASMNADIVQRDWGAFLQAVVNRYRKHAALAGWFAGVGATGEDGYGPNYIVLKGFGNACEKIEPQPLMFTDYSPYFKEKFKEWLKEKYRDDPGLQGAWNDKAVTFTGLMIPEPSEMISDGQQVPMFPDPTDIFAESSGHSDEEKLTGKGKDFYEFRNEMRRQDRRYYSNLIKSADPDHMLIFSAVSDDAMTQDSLADGFAFSLAATSDSDADSLFYYLALDIVKRAVEKGKLAFITREHGCDGRSFSSTGKCEQPQQLRFMELLGKSVKCAGGIFAYAAAPYNKESYSNRSWLPPIWFSSEAMSVAKSINDYSPAEGCIGSFISDAFECNGCNSKMPAPNCRLLNKIYKAYFNKELAPLNFDNGLGSPGKCGDGICDEFEKQCGKCPQDCVPG
jgi:hypothetical protein